MTCEFFKPRTYEIAEKLTKKTLGYRYKFVTHFMTISVYHKSENFFDRIYRRIAKLYYDINTDTVTYVQYLTPPNKDGKVVLWRDIIENLRENDQIIIKKRTSLLSSFEKLLTYLPTKEKFIFVPKSVFREVKYVEK